jgi:sterol desaturase/sphingolipid hydroxylase (fatty acid hydroxylase superfamily)
MGTTMRKMISLFVFPVTLCGVLGAAIFALGNGADPSAVVGVGALTSILLVVAFERIQPFEPDWNHSKGDLLTDVMYLPTYLGVNALIEPLVRVAAVAVGAALSESIGLGLWPVEWSLLAQLALACVIVEAFDYWPHRLLHEVPSLWRFHAIHHNPKRLYWLNATRAHPVEIAFRGIVNVIPLALLGAGEALLAAAALTNLVIGLFQHANIEFELGPLSWIFSVGEMHRWHHSVEMAEANHNYGSNFLFWDVVFGTRYRDATRSGPEQIGIERDELPPSWWAQLGAPFRSR